MVKDDVEDMKMRGVEDANRRSSPNHEARSQDRISLIARETNTLVDSSR